MLRPDHDRPRDLPRESGGGDFDRDAAEPSDVLDEDDAADVDDTPGVDEPHDATPVDERSRASQLWLVAACVCLMAAAALWLLDHADAAFVLAALGVVAWFLNVRVQLRHRNSREDTEPQG